MPAPKRPRRAPTEDLEQLQLFVGWPEQERYELLRPIVLFGQTAEERGRASGVSERTLDRRAERFDAAGMADYHYARAETWGAMRAVHDRFFADYNLQPHWAHRQRPDGKRSPKEVLGWVHGVWCDDAELDRLFRLRAERVFDQGGYLRYKRWRIYGERGLAGRRGAIWLFGEVLTVAYDDNTLAQYRVRYASDTRRIRDLTEARLFENRFPSPQPFLWEFGDVEWHLVERLPAYRARHKPPVLGVQEPLFPLEENV